MPISKKINKNVIFSLINYKKDIDGFSFYNMGLLLHGIPNIIPCTPQGVLFILKKHFGRKLISKKIVIMGRSLIVGKPLALSLINSNCTVTIVHTLTNHSKNECSIADILIIAIGKSDLVKYNWLKKGVFIIDIGINHGVKEIKGDFDLKYSMNTISYITPVPGGVGPITVASLMLNMVKLCYFQNNICH